MSHPALNLYYFNVRARAELIRLIFAAAGRPWNDIRFDLEQWTTYKPKMLLGQVPVLEFPDGTQLGQSMSIARYVARETGLAGKDNLESAKIDVVVDTQHEMNEVLHTKVLIEKDRQKKAEELEKFLAKPLHKHVSKLVKLKKAYSTDKNYFVGSQLSWADLFVYNSLNRVIQSAPQTKSDFDVQFGDVFKTIDEHPKIKKYLNERPTAPF